MLLPITISKCLLFDRITSLFWSERRLTGKNAPGITSPIPETLRKSIVVKHPHDLYTAAAFWLLRIYFTESKTTWPQGLLWPAATSFLSQFKKIRGITYIGKEETLEDVPAKKVLHIRCKIAAISARVTWSTGFSWSPSPCITSFATAHAIGCCA